MKFERRDRDWLIYSLLIGTLLPSILYLFVENKILRHVFLVLSFSFFGGLLFYGIFRIMEKKDLLIYLILAIVCGLCIPYLFTWIHELSHAITVNHFGIDVTKIKVCYPMGGATSMPEGIDFTNREGIAIWINLSGSLGSFPFAVTINRIIYHVKIKFSIFLPFFMITIFRIVSEAWGWIEGITAFVFGIDSGNDIFKVLYYLQLDKHLIRIIPLIILGALIFFLLALIVWFFRFNLIKRIREEILNKSKFENY